MEKIIGYSMGVFVFFMVSWLIIRNKPFADKNLVVLVRTLLSFAAGILGATIPGVVDLEFESGGFFMRAGGAIALFIFTYKFSPVVEETKSTRPNPRNKVKPEENFERNNDCSKVRFAVDLNLDECENFFDVEQIHPKAFGKFTDNSAVLHRVQPPNRLIFDSDPVSFQKIRSCFISQMVLPGLSKPLVGLEVFVDRECVGDFPIQSPVIGEDIDASLKNIVCHNPAIQGFYKEREEAIDALSDFENDQFAAYVTKKGKVFYIHSNYKKEWANSPTKIAVGPKINLFQAYINCVYDERVSDEEMEIAYADHCNKASYIINISRVKEGEFFYAGANNVSFV